MFSSRFLIALLIPVVILGLFFWFLLAADIDKSEVQVAGALVSSADVEFSLQECTISEVKGMRRLTVVFDAVNNGSTTVSLNPSNFHVILTKRDDPNLTTSRKNVFMPMYYTSTCDAAPYSASALPPSSTRSVTIIFWGETLPRGNEWDDHLLSLEYYDAATPIMISKLLNPTEE